MDLRSVKGIVITPEGDCHAFGKQKYAKTKDLSDENYQDPAFSTEIVKADWFQSFIKLNNYNYTNDTVYRQSMNLAGLGLIFLFNGCSLTEKDTEYHGYFIQSPDAISDNQKDVLQENYEYLKQLIDSESAYFEGEAFKPNGDYSWNGSVSDIDSFYEKLEIPKAKENVR